MTFGENLRRLRHDKGWTQDQLAQRTGLRGGHIYKMEKDRSDPKLSTINKLMNALECSAETLISDPSKMGLDNLLRITLEKTKNLPEPAKRAIIDVVDHYCMAYGLKEAFEDENKNLINARLYTSAPSNVLESREEELPKLQAVE